MIGKPATDYERSAMIGMYRMGATFLEISLITGFPDTYVNEIIVGYFKNINNE